MSCVALGFLCTIIGGWLLSMGNIVGFGILLSLDATLSIGAIAFWFGPRKYCRGIFKRRLRAAVASMYWFLIALTLILCFVPKIPPVAIVLTLIFQKIMWAVNFAVACGCLGASSMSKDGDRYGSSDERV